SYVRSLSQENRTIVPAAQNLLSYAASVGEDQIPLGFLPDNVPVTAIVNSGSLTLVGGSTSNPMWQLQWANGQKPGTITCMGSTTYNLDHNADQLAQITPQEILRLLHHAHVNFKGGI